MSDKESAAMATMSTRAEAVRLTPTERRLLTCLVRNAGRIVSHGELLEEMSPRNASMSNLRTSIGRLRSKIEIDPALPNVIITHRGSGYSFAGKEEAQWFPEAEPSRSVLPRDCGRCRSS